jgi:multidrug efflux pump subunit AcrB
MGVSMLAIAATASASMPPVLVVSIQYIVSEKIPEQLLNTVTIPLERVLYRLDRVAQAKSSTSEGAVTAEIQFKGGTTEQDLATVIGQIDLLNFGDQVQVISRAIELRPRRLSYDAAQEHP